MYKGVFITWTYYDDGNIRSYDSEEIWIRFLGNSTNFFFVWGILCAHLSQWETPIRMSVVSHVF